VLSAATDLEAKLSRLENIVGGLSTQMLGFASDCEDETNRMLLSLLNENKELWSHLTKMKYELDRAQGELAARGKRGETIPKDRYDYLTKQQTLLEEKLKRAQQTIEEQIQAERQHEEHMRDVNDALSQAKRRVEVLEGELLAARQQILGMEAEVTQATNSCKQSQQQCVELQSLNALQQTSIANLTQQIQELQEAESSEHRRQVKRLETERDDAREALTRLRSELEDAVARRSAAERDAESRASYFLSYRATLEEQHAAYVRALREEMQSSKVLLERELDELRHELELRTDELHAAARELEEYRGEWQTLRTANRSLEDENHRRSLDLESATSQLQRLEDKLRRTAHEHEQLQQLHAAAEQRFKDHQVEVAKLREQTAALEQILGEERQRHTSQIEAFDADWKEASRVTQTLQEELKKTRMKAAEGDQLKALRERMEKDKEQLMSENLRLHQQYQEVQQQNVAMQSAIQQLKLKLGGNSTTTQLVEDLQRRMAELPTLRQAAEEARLGIQKAREEAEELRRERDEMSARLDFFLEESRKAAKKDSEFDRVFRDATSQVRRLDKQVEDIQQKTHLRATVASSGTSSAYQSAVYSGTKMTTPERRSPLRPWRN
jgi:chromosome segregation ATPase